MAHPNYFVEFDHYTGGSLAEFATALNNCPRKPVGTVQIPELCSMAEYPHGVYLFFDDQGKSWYVGKATSRSFVERVPSHFDQRQDTWFNTLPTLIMRVCKTSTYLDALARGLSLHLVLVGVRDKKTAARVERVLRAYLNPKLNALPGRRYTGQELLSSFAATASAA